jgi:hypothetical protein
VTTPDAVSTVADLGVALFPAGIAMSEARERYRRRYPEASTLRGEALSAHTFPRLFGGVIAPAMLPALQSVLREWRPDLVIGEPGALAVPLACALHGVPHVTHGYGLMPPVPQLREAMARFGDRWAACGLAPPADAGLYRHGYIDIAPPSLQTATGACAAGIPAVWRLGPSSEVRKSSLPLRLHEALRRQSRQIVYLTFGTVFNRNAALVSIARSLSRLDALVVVTRGVDDDAARWAGLPANVHVEPFVEQSALLPRCDLVVSHAGAGTMLGAAAHGVPQLLLPQAADQFRNARALASTGAGVFLTPDRQEEAALLRRARCLLSASGPSVAARALAREIASMPDPATVARRLGHEFGVA